ncbi:10092_t:CDS:2, partial [Diversispora eburnea]
GPIIDRTYDNIPNVDILLGCNSRGLNYNPTELRAISTRCRSNLKNYPTRFRKRYSRMATAINDHFERNPVVSSCQLSNSYRITPLRISTSDVSRLQLELINLPTPRSLEEAETMLCNRPLLTEENPILHEGDNPVNLHAST